MMKVKAIKTIKGNEPMQVIPDLEVKPDDGVEGSVINIIPDFEYQDIEGFGGAFTEAASTTIDKLSKKNRDKILKLYFDRKTGLAYNYGRVHMNSCDFSLGNYSCVEENDKTLETFNIDRDKKSLVPMINDKGRYEIR
jgi:glucosylceramidase